MIYGRFIESKAEDFCREIRFLSKAVSRDSHVRLMMDCLRIEPSDADERMNKGMTVDGRRLHIVDPLFFGNLDPGLYRILKAGQKKSWLAKIEGENNAPPAFPDYRKFIPQGPWAFTGGLPAAKTNKDELINFFRQFPEPTYLDFTYVFDLAGAGREWEVYWKSPIEAMLFRSGSYTAVVMPRQV